MNNQHSFIIKFSTYGFASQASHQDSARGYVGHGKAMPGTAGKVVAAATYTLFYNIQAFNPRRGLVLRSFHRKRRIFLHEVACYEQ
jgi:hypothetical protein